MQHSILLTLLLALLGMSSVASAHDHDHVDHNFVLYGDSQELFASHIVYKSPHNYQVIMRVQLQQPVLEKLEVSRNEFPTDTYLLLLEHMNISQIQSADQLYGKLIRETAEGERIILSRVTLPSDSFLVIFFNELPFI